MRAVFRPALEEDKRMRLIFGKRFQPLLKNNALN